MTKKSISLKLAEKTFRELGLDPKTGKPIRQAQGKPLISPKSIYTSPSSSPTPPFRIKALEKTRRQSPKGKAYQYSAVYRNAYTLRLLGKIFTSGLEPLKYRYLISQIDSELRSVVANIREGYLRPTSTEYSTFLGYSQGSLEEFRGDIIDAKDDGILPSRPGTSLTGIGIHLKPPTFSYHSPNISFDPLGEVKRSDLTFEIFLELINKTDWLLKRAVQGIDKKIIEDEKEKLKNELKTHWRKEW